MDLLDRPVLQADHRIAYGEDACQFGDLWLPALEPDARAPLVVFLHGGWWKSAYDLGYAGYLCRALRERGHAVWSLEYRRVGETGGGWPTTFEDVAAGFDFVTTLAQRWPIDRTRVIAMGHSAGGHLAYWLAGRRNLPQHATKLAAQPDTPALCGVVSLAGAVDLRLTIELAGDGIFAHDRDEVLRLMGAAPEEDAMRYASANPGELLPFGAAQLLLQGTNDDQIPAPLPVRWQAQAKLAGDRAEVMMLDGADHFDVVDPESRAWPRVMAAVEQLLR